MSDFFEDINNPLDNEIEIKKCDENFDFLILRFDSITKVDLIKQNLGFDGHYFDITYTSVDFTKGNFHVVKEMDKKFFDLKRTIGFI